MGTEKQQKEQNLTVEETFARLSEVVEQMESDQISLEESLNL